MDKVESIFENSLPRINAALAFDSSPARLAWSEQRIKNERDDLTLSLPKGLRKLQQHSKQIVADITSD